MFLRENDVVLFQGDSVTDCGRDRSNPNSMGYGYPIRIAGRFNMLYPEMNIKFYNRGVSGDRSIDLVNRWQADCLDLKPTVLSILIGINDVWRRYDSNDPTTVEAFEANYRKMLDAAKEQLDCRLILIEPFVLSATENRDHYREDLDPKIQVIRRLAKEYGALYLALDGMFAQAQARVGGIHWTVDGVHPSDAGHALIAKAFLELIGAE